MEFFGSIKPIIITVHACAGILGVVVTSYTDILFFKSLADAVITPNEKRSMGSLSWVIWTALGLLIFSGIFLFLSNPLYYAQSSKFLVKMVVVDVIFVNGLLLNWYISPRLTMLRFGTLEDRKRHRVFKRVAFFSGVVSVSSWYTAFILGVVPRIPVSFEQGMLIYLGILVVGGIVSQFVYSKFARISRDLSKDVEK